jgi:hypothetical protein
MFGGLKIAGAVLAVAMIAGTGAMYVQANDIKKNYTLVDARITSVSVDCFIKAGKESIVEKETNDLAYMDCAMAPTVASMHGFKESDIKKRAKVTYQYRSPADQAVHTGSYTRERDVDDLVAGEAIQVYAHNTEPDDSRTTKGNLFISDTGV